MNNGDPLDFDEEPSKKPQRRVKEFTGRTPPHSLEAEEYLISCCLLDGEDVISRCIEAHIRPESFYLSAHGIIFGRLIDLHKRHILIDVAVLAEDLKAEKLLDVVGGLAFLTQVSSRIPTTAQAGYFIEKVRELEIRRELIKISTSSVEEAYGSDDTNSLIDSLKLRLSGIESWEPVAAGRSPSSFKIPPDGDKSTLLGNRFLNRGDGGILVSTSGMGKSSMSLQAAYSWALGRDFFGIKPNGMLKSLIIQSEDSDGDIAEVIASVDHGLGLTDADRKVIEKNLVIVTERVRRGARFIARLRSLIKLYKPDIVLLNPLVAFMDGDLTAAKDVGAFLREGLNSLNETPTFGYIIVHHTTKPPTDKNKNERTWNEVMYDMGGSYDIPGWARFVINLKATEIEGQFDLVLSKRGSRAGVTKRVPQGAGFRDEPVTRIPVGWARGTINVEGRSKPLPLIFWEPRSVAEKTIAEKVETNGNGIDHYVTAIPRGIDKAASLHQIHRIAAGVDGISLAKFGPLLRDACQRGQISKTLDEGGIKYYV